MKRLVLILALSTTACGLFGSTPKRTLSKYLDAVLRGRYEAAYPLASNKDRAARSLEKYLAENPARSNAGVKALASRTQYEIGEISVEGDRAVATVTVTHPDLGSRSAEALGALFASAPAPGLDEKEIGRLLAEKSQGNEVAVTRTIRRFNLVRDSEGWRVFLGWEGQALVEEARRLRETGKLAEALEKYEKALEVDPESAEAGRGRQEVETQLHALRAMQSYMENNVEIIAFKVTRGRGRGSAGTSVSGKILNNGHRTLGQVEVTVYFQAADGRVIAERAYQPVPATEITYYGEERSLKRGYVKEFGYIVDGALPKEWSGKARAAVTRIEFEEKS